ncbi:MAG: tRNA-dihydrouridine synthase [Fibrobacterales bacterium]
MSKIYGEPHKKILKVGNLEIFPNAILSPMHGVTNSSFRRTVKEVCGGVSGLLVSEFVSVEGITRFIPNTITQMAFHPEEHPFCIQVFGADIERMVKGAAMAQEHGADMVEINAGCPAPKVVKRGGGSGLLKDLDHLQEMLQKMRKEISIPLSLKVRLGWDSDTINVVETAQLAENENLDLFIIHGRTRTQGYRGEADWEKIAEAKQAVNHIPVVGNGDVKTVEEFITRLNTYGVDGISIGRGAMHNPWIFGQIVDYYEGREIRVPTYEDQKNVFMVYKKKLEEAGVPEFAILGKMKQITARLMKSIPNASEGRMLLLRTDELDGFMGTLDSFYSEQVAKFGEVPFDPGAVKDLNGKARNEIQEGEHFSK